MKLYLTVTGTVFAMVAIAHLLRTIAERSRFSTDPWFLLEGPGIGLFAAATAIWAFRVRRDVSSPMS